LHLHEFIPHLIDSPLQGGRLDNLQGTFTFITSLFVLLLDQPSLDIAHALLQCANVSNSPLFELLETPCDDEERAGNIKRTLVGKLCIERRGFTGWGARW
jgi:hypothetical protein